MNTRTGEAPRGPGWAVLRAALVIGVLLAPAERAEAQADVLGELDRLHIRVPFVSEMALSCGVKPEDLTREVGLRVGKSGVLVLSALPEDPPPGPFLAVVFEAIELTGSEIAYHVSLELREDVQLQREPGHLTTASVWYLSSFGLSSATDLPTDAVEAVLALADEFLSDASPLPN